METSTPQEALVATVTKPAPRLGEVSPGAPRALAALVDRSLSFLREDRFQSAKAMQTAVREVYHELTGGLAQAAPREAAEPGIVMHPGGSDDEPTAVISRPMQKLLGARMARPSSTTAKSPRRVSPDSEPTIVDAPPSMTIRRSATGLVPPEVRNRRLASIFDSADFGDQSQWSEAVEDGSVTLNAQAAQALLGSPEPEGAAQAPAEPEDATLPVSREEPGKTPATNPPAAAGKRRALVLVAVGIVALLFVAFAVFVLAKGRRP